MNAQLFCPHCDKVIPLRAITTDNHTPHTLRFDVAIVQDLEGWISIQVHAWLPEQHPTTIPEQLFKPDKPS